MLSRVSFCVSVWGGGINIQESGCDEHHSFWKFSHSSGGRGVVGGMVVEGPACTLQSRSPSVLHKFRNTEESGGGGDDLYSEFCQLPQNSL